jgi:hypothetical protein
LAEASSSLWTVVTAKKLPTQMPKSRQARNELGHVTAPQKAWRNAPVTPASLARSIISSIPSLVLNTPKLCEPSGQILDDGLVCWVIVPERLALSLFAVDNVSGFLSPSDLDLHSLPTKPWPRKEAED